MVGELHRSGVLGLVHLHWVSLGNMRRLVDWHVERAAATAPAVNVAELLANGVQDITNHMVADGFKLNV